MAIMAVAGCGNNGGATAGPSPTPATDPPLVTGTVCLPYGILASADSWWHRADRGLFPSAYADASACSNPNTFPAPGVRVTLWRVDHADAANGVIGDYPGDAPVRLNWSPDTDGNGAYTIIKSQAAGSIDACGFMVAVGDLNGPTQTRAFVLAAAPGETTVDVVSETVVGVVLNRLTKAPPVDLCANFSTAGLQAITNAVADAVFIANGTDVYEMNQAALALALQSSAVSAAVDAATGVPVTTE